jgi:DNA-binding transcriptional MerR regulator
VTEPRYAIGELASRGGVSRRTVRYYVQEGLLPSPFGVGRGDHYGPQHLERLLRIKAMQEAGLELQEIREAIEGGTRVPPEPNPAPALEPWRRITLSPGVELHVAQDVALPPRARLRELAEWCRQHFTTARHSKEERDA